MITNMATSQIFLKRKENTLNPNYSLHLKACKFTQGESHCNFLAPDKTAHFSFITKLILVFDILIVCQKYLSYRNGTSDLLFDIL